MNSDTSLQPVSPLRARMIEDMTVRGFNEHTCRDYVRHVRSFAAFIGRSPDTATAEDLRLFQLHQTRIGMQPPSINGAVSMPFNRVEASGIGVGKPQPGGIGSPPKWCSRQGEYHHILSRRSPGGTGLAR